MEIWKSVIPVIATEQFIEMPKGAKLLDVQWQDEKLCLWYQCEPTASRVKRRIGIYGTGQALPAWSGDYVATIQMSMMVWHVYDRGECVA